MGIFQCSFTEPYNSDNSIIAAVTTCIKMFNLKYDRMQTHRNISHQLHTLTIHFIRVH